MTKKGYVLVELLLMMLVIAMLLNISLVIFSILGSHQFLNDKIQDEIMIYQLRKILLIADNVTVMNDELNFDYQGQNWKLYHVNNKLIMTTGTQVILDDIDECYFSLEDSVIFITYARADISSKRMLKHD